MGSIVPLRLSWQQQTPGGYCQHSLGPQTVFLMCRVSSASLTCISVAFPVVAGPEGLVWGANTLSPPQAGESHPTQGQSRTPPPRHLSASAPPPPVGGKRQHDLWEQARLGQLSSGLASSQFVYTHSTASYLCSLAAFSKHSSVCHRGQPGILYT